ncbi:hypothetical protein BDR22DRAFT_887961 [Usnea florida]
MFLRLITATWAETLPLTGRASPLNLTFGAQLSPNLNVSGCATKLKDYPIDPYQMRVHDTTTSLIFSKYGPPIHFQTFLELVAKAQYQIVQAVIAAHGDGPVLQRNFEWSEKGLYLRISRPLARQDLTWLMLADTLEGVRDFFNGLQGWFETSITILDDIAGPVGDGIIAFGR